MEILLSLIDKVSFFDSYDYVTLAKFPISPVPPWFLPHVDIDFSLCKTKKKPGNTDIFLSLYREKIDKYKEYLHIYTDGSKKDDHSACAFYVHKLNLHKSYTLSPSSVYTT